MTNSVSAREQEEIIRAADSERGGGGGGGKSPCRASAMTVVVSMDGARCWSETRSGWGVSCACHDTVLVFRLLFPQRPRTLLSTCELFSVSISVWVFFITTTCPNLLSCFCSFLSSLLLLFLLPLCPPPSSLQLSHHPSLLSPPYRMCVCHVFHQSYGTECNQSHAPVSNYGGTVLLPFLQLSLSLSLLDFFCAS